MKSTLKVAILLATFLLSISFVFAQEPLRIIMIGAHPDDCDINGGGTAALFAQMGHQVKFVSLTNGDKGHHLMDSEALAERRKQEMQEVARILGIEYDALNNHDGELMPTIENRKAVIKLICDWQADVVISHRPYDYHPDHRNTSIIVQDAAYMISVPKMYPEGKPLMQAPVFLYMADRFQKPYPFSPDIVIDITSVVDKKVNAICAHESQVFEWLPWNNGYDHLMPADKEGKRKFIGERYLTRNRSIGFEKAAEKWYTPIQLKDAAYFEAFEICEYGSMPDKQKILRLFPMLPR